MAAGRRAVPAVGHTIGRLNIPKGVAQLLGGADYGTITGWFRSEIGAIYGPLVIGALAITGAAATTAGEEEDRILALVLAHPITRSRLIAAKATAIAVIVVTIALAAWVGMVCGVALGGGGISAGTWPRLRCTWRSSGSPWAPSPWRWGRVPAGGPWPPESPQPWHRRLVDLRLRPARERAHWLKYLSLFYYYASHDPLTNGLGVGGLVVLGAATIVFSVVAVGGLRRHDLRA